jgi:predicted Zn-dependent peptidase
MLFKGTQARSASDIARTIDRLGGYLNAFTERESVCFYCTLPADCADTAIEVLCDMIFSSTIPQSEFEKEKTVIINEILSVEDDPEDISYDKFLQSIWPGSPLSGKIAGEANEVEAIRRDELDSFYRSRFRPENLLVCASGAIDEPRFLDSLVRRLDAAGKGAGPGRAAEEVMPLYRKSVAYERMSIQQVQLYVGQPFELKGDFRDFHAFSVFNCAFGESMSSRLFQNIRENLGYCYSIFSFFAFANDVGLWCVNGSTTGKLFFKLKSAVMDEIRSVITDGLSEMEVRNAVSHLKGSHILAAEDMEHRMKRLARQFYYNGKVLSLDEGLAQIASIDADAVNDIARNRFSLEGFSLFAYGALKPGRELRAIMKAGRA